MNCRNGFGDACAQVHLLQSELFDEIAAQGFTLSAGGIGENVTTFGIDILSLPKGARLKLGGSAVVEVTGLRNPCGQIDHFQQGLRDAVLVRDEDGALVRKAGIMGVVLQGGEVATGDEIDVELPLQPWHKLRVV